MNYRLPTDEERFSHCDSPHLPASGSCGHDCGTCSASLILCDEGERKATAKAKAFAFCDAFNATTDDGEYDKTAIEEAWDEYIDAVRAAEGKD